MKLLMVEWLDSHSRTGWKTDDIIRDIRPAVCVSVGMAFINSDCITLYGSRSNQGDVGDVLCIPRIAVRRVFQLKALQPLLERQEKE